MALLSQKGVGLRVLLLFFLQKFRSGGWFYQNPCLAPNYILKRFSGPNGNFWTPPRIRDIPAKFPGHPRFLPFKSKEDKLSREGTNFSATTRSSGRPHPTGQHRVVQISVPFLGGGAKHHFRWPPLLTISSGFRSFAGASAIRFAPPWGKSTFCIPRLAFSGAVSGIKS